MDTNIPGDFFRAKQKQQTEESSCKLIETLSQNVIPVPFEFSPTGIQHQPCKICLDCHRKAIAECHSIEKYPDIIK